MAEWVTIENVPGGYRVNCARCGGEIAIQPEGWKIETFLRRLKRIERLHAACPVAVTDDEAPAHAG